MNSGKLAIDGGDPVAESSISFHEPDLGEEELKAVQSSFEDGWVAGPGPFCESVENRLEQRWSVPRVLTTSSCTHALETALLRLDLDASDEVIVPSYTYVSTALAVVRAGATPVFADVEESTLTLSVDSIKAKRTDSTRAVIYVHYGGYPGPIQPVVTFCKDHSIDLIEDAAQAIGARRRNRPAGTVGRFGAFSFHGTKSLTSGEGGLLVVNHSEDVKPVEMIRDKGTDRSRYLNGDVDRYTWRSTGSSYVMSDIQGAVLSAQLDRMTEILRKRRSVQSELRQAVREIDTENRLSLVEPESKNSIEENGHLTAFRVHDENRARSVLEALQAEGIQAREHYQPLHRSPYAREVLNVNESLPVTESIARQLIRLPTHTKLSGNDLDSIKLALRKVYDKLIKS